MIQDDWLDDINKNFNDFYAEVAELKRRARKKYEYKQTLLFYVFIILLCLQLIGGCK